VNPKKEEFIQLLEASYQLEPKSTVSGELKLKKISAA
jgi:hypothetical protein